MVSRRSSWAAVSLILLLGGAFILAVNGADEAEKADFKAALADAVDAQEFREEAPDEVKAKIIEEAPGATLFSGTGDVSTTGACAGDIDNFCMDVKPGEGRISECLTKQLEEESKGNVEGKTITEECKKEIADFKVDRGTNVNKNLPLAEACKADATSLCGDSDPTDTGAVLACLRNTTSLAQPFYEAFPLAIEIRLTA